MKNYKNFLQGDISPITYFLYKKGIRGEFINFGLYSYFISIHKTKFYVLISSYNFSESARDFSIWIEQTYFLEINKIMASEEKLTCNIQISKNIIKKFRIVRSRIRVNVYDTIKHLNVALKNKGIYLV